MTTRILKAGFIPLTDAAPLIIAHEIGFAGAEALQLDLRPAPSWSALRDWLAIGVVDAAHMLSPVPVATALGLGAPQARLSALSVLSVNGNVIGTSPALARCMENARFVPDFSDPAAAGRALKHAAQGPLRIGVPFPFSLHAELLFHWLGPAGLADADIRTVPPPQMADALAANEIDAFCVGEPWGSTAVEQGAGNLLLPGKAIWAGAPEKVLAVRQSWAREQASQARRLIRALWKAGRWLAEPGNRPTAAEILSRPEYLNTSPEILDRAFSGAFLINPAGTQRFCPDFIRFSGGAAGLPAQEDARWIGRQLARRSGLDPERAAARAAGVFETDLYRDALSSLHVTLPEHSAPSGDGTVPIPHAGHSLGGQIFDPAAES